MRNPRFVTTHKSTYVYAVPDRSGKKVGELIAGTQLVIIGEYGDYWVVNLRSASGFIHKSDVQYIN
ncbi:MAG TPA: SH3 domain-containing protein [Clostridia bacterium]|nr:SH3 domain-containing protein [Clostridia bacterium]